MHQSNTNDMQSHYDELPRKWLPKKVSSCDENSKNCWNINGLCTDDSHTHTLPLDINDTKRKKKQQTQNISNSKCETKRLKQSNDQIKTCENMVRELKKKLANICEMIKRNCSQILFCLCLCDDLQSYNVEYVVCLILFIHNKLCGSFVWSLALSINLIHCSHNNLINS